MQARCISILLASAFMLAAEPSALQAQCTGMQWVERTPATVPSPRMASSMSYDSGREVIVMFGGENSVNELAETWEWDGDNWAPVAVDGPEPRSSCAMAFDSRRGVTVLFGGLTLTPQGALHDYGDTWEWDGATWTLRSTAGPSPRNAAAMVYDSARGVSVLFGGYSIAVGGISEFHADTWEWDGTSWAPRSTSGPAPRSGHAMAFDASLGVALLFGGGGPAGPIKQDTWEWNGATWQQRSGIAPQPGTDGAMVYDANNRVCTRMSALINGIPLQIDPCTYLWNNGASAWVRCRCFGPVVFRAGTAYDDARQCTVLFGGDGFGGPNNRTWQYQPIPILYVDSASADGDGSSASPFHTVRLAIDEGGNGTTISVRTGSYAEGPITFSKRGIVLATGGTVTIGQ